MIRDITIGQYYNNDSVIHRLDPRTKILWTVFYMIILFSFDGICSYAVISAFTLFAILLSKVPFKFLLRGLKPVMILILLTAGLNMFLTPGEKIIFSKGVFKITQEGLFLAIKMCVRIVLLIAGSSLLTLTTTPTVLTSGLEKLLSPLKKVGIPISVFVMMIGIALRFIPTLLDETDKIIKAQTSRGADFENKNPIKKVKAMVPILIPLFVSAFRRADELAAAMECRCYNCDTERSSYRRFSYGMSDFFSLITAVFLLFILIIIKVVQ